MPVTRSALFVPGHKPDWIDKALRSGADQLILDLEDSVPDRDKVASRTLVRSGVIAIARAGRRCAVRVNGLATGLTEGDLAGIFCPELTDVSLPKVETPADLQHLDRLLAALEGAAGIAAVRVATPLVLETARAMHGAWEIGGACPRVRDLSLAAGPGGDASRSVGYQWSRAGLETLYLRSKIVLDARAAGVLYPTISSWWDIPDTAGLEADARFNRSLGYRGQVVMHPTHVPVVNRVFTPSAEEIAWAEGLLRTYEEGLRAGHAAVLYQGDMIDTAMAETARALLAFAREIAARSPA